MGMASSQVRLLQLTSRKNDIGYELTRLSNEKVSLSREMQKVSKTYQNALNQKVLKWSNNSGVSYIDLSYQNLMRPSSMNQNSPYLLTDCSDRVVVDAEYKKFAEMISSNGAAGGNWESVRTKVLAELTGIDSSKIENSDAYFIEIGRQEDIINKLIEEEPQKPTKKTNIETFIKNLGSSTGISNGFSKGSDWSSAYSQDGTINLGDKADAATNLRAILNNISTKLGAYLDDPEKLQTACDTFYTSQIDIINNPTSKGNKQSLESDQTALNGNSNKFTINVQKMIDTIMGAYCNNGGEVAQSGYNNKALYVWNDIDSLDYKNWETKHATWQTEYDAAKSDYNNAVSSKNQLFTSEEESLIEFYDVIFSSIAENGWTYNNQANDTDYLNDMLQNNLYTITTVNREKNLEYDNISKTYSLDWDNDYSTDIASNFTNIFTVNDTDAREDALVEYEYQKNIINQKETRIDTRMKDLETEQAAVNQMIQSIDKVKNDNIERTMEWSG